MGSVLIIDDDGVTRDAISAFLSRMGHSAATAADGPAGIEAFRACGADLVILDRNLPGLSGSKVFAAIRKISPAVPILVVTGYDDAAAEEAYARLGAAGFISKGAGLSPVLAAAEKILRTPGGAVRPSRRSVYRRRLVPAVLGTLLFLSLLLVFRAATRVQRADAPARPALPSADGPAAVPPGGSLGPAPAASGPSLREVLVRYSDRPVMAEFIRDLEKEPSAAGTLLEAAGADASRRMEILGRDPAALRLAAKYMARPDFVAVLMEMRKDPALATVFGGGTGR